MTTRASASALGALVLFAGVTMAGAAVAVEGRASLAGLKTTAEALAASGDRVYQQAGRLLVHLAAIDVSDAARSEALAAVRSVVEAAGAISAHSRDLGDGLPASTAARPAADPLKMALLDFDRSSRTLAQSSDAVLRALAAAQAESDLARQILQALTLAAQSYADAQARLTATLAVLADRLLPAPVRAAPVSRVLLSVYGFVDDKGPEPGYGLYTYVLFPTTSDRNAALLEVLLRTPREELFADRHAVLNLLAVPVRDTVQAHVVARISTKPAEAIAAPDIYDYALGQKLLGRFCLAAGARAAQVCSSDWRGPFLLSYPHDLISAGDVSEPYLLVDLSYIDAAAFGEFVRAVKEQVMLPDFSSREKIDTYRLQLLDITLKAADWLLPVKEGIAGILATVPRGKG